MDAIDRVLRRQAGVISRRQVLGLGGSEVLVARRLRRREWARVHDGVYVDHTGRLSSVQREWVALLLHPGSVLAGGSALRASGLAGASGREVELAVPHGRHLAPAPGVRVVQLRGFDRATLPRASPPRMRVEHAALVVASRARSDDAAVAVLADVVREGLTLPVRLEDVLVDLRRLPRRALLREVVMDIAEGAESPLERRFLRDVERRHGLPRGERQVRVASDAGTVVRDVRYAPYRTLVELDGRLGHSRAVDRWADLGRDLTAAVHGEVTLRLGWQQVLDPCRSALLVTGVLVSRGWEGRPRRCGACTGRPEGVS